MFYDILKRENDFLGDKNTKFETSKNRDSSKGFSPWFWSKIGHFPTLVLFEIQGRKMCFTIF